MPFIWVCLLFGLLSSNFSIFPTVVTLIFGTKNVGTNVGLIFSSQIFSAFIGILYVMEIVNAAVDDWKIMCFIIASIQLSFHSHSIQQTKYQESLEGFAQEK